MKFYSIRHSLDKKILGHYPQVNDVIYHCHVWDEPLFIDRFHFEKININPIVANPVLHPKSKLTDIIDTKSAMGFSFKILISGKLKSLIEKYRNSGIQFIQCSVFQNGIENKDYWLLNIFESYMGFINFEKSKINVRVRKKEGGTELNPVEVKTLEEFHSIVDFHKEKMEIVTINNIILNDKANEVFFMLQHVEGGIKHIVSEKLKKEIEEAGCIGIEFQPIELSYNEWIAPGGEREKVYGKF